MNRIFIVGSPRSGTTVLQQIIMRNFEIFSCKETHFFSLLNPKSFLGKAIYPNFFLKYRAVKSLNKILSSEKKSLRFIFHKNIGAVFQDSPDESARAQGASLWLEKTPRHLHFIDEIDDSVDNAIFIHIIRNGKSVTESLHKAITDNSFLWQGLGRSDFKKADAILRWNRDINISYDYVGQKNHYFVIYERLIIDPDLYINGLTNVFEKAQSVNQNDFEIIDIHEVWKINNKSKNLIKQKSVIDPEFYSKEYEFELYNKLVDHSSKQFG